MTDGIKSLPLEMRIRLHKDMIDYSLVPSCFNCEHNKSNDVDIKRNLPPSYECGKFNSVPPPEIFVCGCRSWSQNIPF